MTFSAIRALSRNRLIHAMGSLTFVAQSGCGKGGTWSGSVQNLRNRWTPVCCFDDGSEGARQLIQMGARGVEHRDLWDFSALIEEEISLF